MFPHAAITGFDRPSEALLYARFHAIALAFLDIELSHTNGLDLCRDLLAIRPFANVVFLTAYREYSFDAWETGACGFLLKPITAEAARSLPDRLRHPVPSLLAASASGKSSR